MGTGYKGNTDYHHSLSDNLPDLKKSYPYTNGYFGEKGRGRDYTRNIVSDDPVGTAKDFYDDAEYGGIEEKMHNGKGMVTKMKDGTIISFREVSSSDGSPAVEINILKSDDPGGVKYQKIHFVKGVK